MARYQAHKPRGEGTYWAQVEGKCDEHGSHFTRLSSADDVAWIIGQMEAHRLWILGIDVRCLIWHTREAFVATSRDDVSPRDIEDEIPF